MVALTIEAAGSHVETSALVGPSRSCIPVEAAVLVGGRERQATSNDHGRIPLPSSEEQVRHPRTVSHKPLAPAERQLVDRSQNQDAVAVEVLTPVTLTQIRLVIAIVVIGPRVGVGAVERQAEGGAMVHFDLQCLVRIRSVITPVVKAVAFAAYDVRGEAVGIRVGRTKRSVVG